MNSTAKKRTKSTGRQAKMLKTFTFALSACVGLSAFLVFTNISNTALTQPVRIAEILDGATAFAGEDESERFAAVTLDPEQLTETLFSRELLTFTTDWQTLDEVLLSESDDSYETETQEQTAPPEMVDPPIYLPENLFVETALPPSFNTGAGSPQNNALIAGSEEAPVLPETTTAEQTIQTAATTSRTTISEAAATVGTTAKTTDTSRTTAFFLTSATPSETKETSAPASYTTFRSLESVSSTTSATTARTTEVRIYTALDDTTTAPSETEPPKTTVSYTTPKSITTTAKATKAKTETTAAGTTEAHTEKTAFTNVGGGVFSEDNSVYMTLFELVNEARREAGLNELWYSARVHEVCEIRTTELSSYYSHTRPDGTRFSTAFKEVGIAYNRCGENIAYGRNMFKTPEEVFEAWMNSPSHRDNILCEDYECVAFGLCILEVGADTYYYWSQEFAEL